MPSKRSQIPEKIRIGAYDVKVVLRPMKKNSGEYDANVCLIVLDTGATLARLRVVLLHEIMHAAWDSAGIQGRPDEETAVDGLSNVLAQVIRDNPKLMRFLTGGSKKK